jgi:hypothetical protein
MRRFLTVLVLTACSLALPACGGSSARSQPVVAGTAADITPASATSFASIRVDPANPQVRPALGLIERMPGGGKALADLVAGIGKKGTSLADLQRALGPTVELAAVGSGDKQGDFVMTKPRDAAKLQQLLKKGGKSSSREIEGWLVLGDSEDELDTFESEAEKGRLADSNDFREAFAGLAEGSLARVYVSGSLLDQALESGLAGLPLPGIENPVEWIGLSVRAEAGAFRLEGAVKGVKAKNASSSLIAEAPYGAVAVLNANGSSYDLEREISKLSDDARLGPALIQLEALGIKLDDIAGLAGGEIAVYLTSTGFIPAPANAKINPRSGLVVTEPGVTALFTGPKAAAALPAVEKLASLLATQMKGGVRSVTVAGVRAKEITLGTMRVFIGVKNGALFITTNPAGLAPARKLGANPAYVRAEKALAVPKETAGVLFADLSNPAEIAGLISSLSAAQGSNGTMVPFLGVTVAKGSKPTGASVLLAYLLAAGDRLQIKGIVTVE